MQNFQAELIWLIGNSYGRVQWKLLISTSISEFKVKLTHYLSYIAHIPERRNNSAKTQNNTSFDGHQNT